MLTEFYSCYKVTARTKQELLGQSWSHQMDFKRARTEEQKSIRIDQIIEATLDLYETIPYDKLTLATIAENLDFSRANIYQYVRSKEDIFFLVTVRESEALIKKILDAFSPARIISIEEFAERLAKIFIDSSLFFKLLSVNNSLINDDVSPELKIDSIEDSRLRLYEIFVKLCDVVSKTVDGLDADKFCCFYMWASNYTIGFYRNNMMKFGQYVITSIGGYAKEDISTSLSRFFTMSLKALLGKN